MLKHALKEWAVICRALGDGRQALIIRKGGIAEPADDFHLEQNRFWLYPTYVHQQRDGIKPEAIGLLEKVEAERPPPGVIRLAHFAEVAGVYHLNDVVGALLLEHLYLWSADTVHRRFDYRQPGLHIMPLRVYRVPQVLEVPETPQYAGCKSWVELDRELPTDGATPVLEEEAFRDLLRTLDRVLNPTALA